MAFEKYVPTKTVRVKKAGRPKVSIWRTGELKFSPQAVEQFQLGDYRYAVLYFDPEKQQLGIVLTNTREKGALKLKRSRSALTLRVEGLLRKHGIRPGASVQRAITRDRESGMLIVKLKTMRKKRSRVKKQ